MQKELIQATTNTNLAVYFIWMPMVPTDNNPGALEIAHELGDDRTRHFHDPQRRIGIALERDHFEQFAKELLASLSPDDPLRENIAERLKRPAEHRPVWDAVLLYEPGAEWNDVSPKPNWAARQVDFFGDSESGQPTGVILKFGAKQSPKPTGWFIELRDLRKTLTAIPPFP